MPSCRSRRSRGVSVCELPAVLVVALLFIALPLMGMATLAFRNALFHFAVSNACAQAARAPSYQAAITQANGNLQQTCSAFKGIQLGDHAVSIVSVDLATNVEHESSVPLSANLIDPKANLYFIKVSAQSSLDPIVNMGGCAQFQPGIEGLTKPYRIAASYQVYAEHPIGLAI